MAEPTGGANRERKRYRDLNAEELLAYHREWMRRWRAANPERALEMERKHSAARRKRKRVADRARARSRERAATPAERERLKRFREEHPEKVREYRARWRAKDPERAARIQRESAMRSRDRHADEVRAKQRARAAENRVARSAAHKEYYAANKERLAEYAREAARVRRRLAAAGLPPKSVHKSYANEKRAHLAAADAFFARQREPEEIARLMQREPLRSAELEWSATVGRRLRARERAENARRTREFFEGPTRLSNGIDLALKNRGLRARLTGEIRMDSRAREISGKPPYDLEVEMRRRVAGTMAEDLLDARLLSRQLQNPLWWKVHSGDRIKDVFDWARAHAAHSPSHMSITSDIARRVLERRQQVGKSQKRAAPEATGPAAGHSPTPTSSRLYI